jgi:hypothetical protein
MITLECNYSKKLGLPQFSSHQFSITLRTEINDLSQVQSESARLYKLLQDGVDSSIQQVGYLPGENGKRNGNDHGNGSTTQTETWQCSGKQRELILKVINESNLDKAKVENLAVERFGKGVKALNKLEASGLIEELLEMTGQGRGGGRNRFQSRAGAR